MRCKTLFPCSSLQVIQYHEQSDLAFIFLILLHHAHSVALTIYLDTGTGKHCQIVNVSELAESKGADYCTTVLGLYVFTREDMTSAFKGKGKVGPLKKLQSHPKYHAAFR